MDVYIIGKLNNIVTGCSFYVEQALTEDDAFQDARQKALSSGMTDVICLTAEQAGHLASTLFEKLPEFEIQTALNDKRGEKNKCISLRLFKNTTGLAVSFAEHSDFHSNRENAKQLLIDYEGEVLVHVHSDANFSRATHDISLQRARIDRAHIV